MVHHCRQTLETGGGRVSKLEASKVGKAPAEALSTRRRKMIAKKAVEARWRDARKS
jgi:hypothetical protein